MKLSELRKISQFLSDTKTDVSPGHSQEILQAVGLDPGSVYQELELDSPYVDTHQDIGYHNQTLQFHSHTFYELLCCRNTCNAEYLVGTERYKLQKGDIIFVPPGISHRPLLPEQMPEPYIRDVLWISESFIQRLIKSIPELQSPVFQSPFLFRTAGTRWEYLCQWIRNGMLEAESGQVGWNSLVSANTANILIQLLRTSLNDPIKPLKAEKPELLDQVLTYIEDHLSERITLAETAHHFYVSESTITQTFRKKMDISFYRCVTQRRLITAKKLIETGISLESTAEQVGFSDYSSFFRAFKQEYGISPRQYRKMQNNEKTVSPP